MSILTNESDQPSDSKPPSCGVLRSESVKGSFNTEITKEDKARPP